MGKQSRATYVYSYGDNPQWVAYRGEVPNKAVAMARCANAIRRGGPQTWAYVADTRLVGDGVIARWTDGRRVQV